MVIVNRFGVIANSRGEIVNHDGPMLASASRAALISAKSGGHAIVKSYGVIVDFRRWLVNVSKCS